MLSWLLTGPALRVAGLTSLLRWSLVVLVLVLVAFFFARLQRLKRRRVSARNKTFQPERYGRAVAVVIRIVSHLKIAHKKTRCSRERTSVVV